MIALALLSSLFVLLIVLSLPGLCVSFDSKLENGSKLMQKLRRFGSIENLRKTVYIAKSTNAVDANFLYTHEELRTRGPKVNFSTCKEERAGFLVVEASC